MAGKNDVLAGLLVVVAIVGAIAAVVMVAGLRDVLGTTRYTVVFGTEEGVSGLSQGAAVQVGGVRVGVVSGVQLVAGDAGGESAVHVEVRVDSGLPIREGAVAELSLPLLGTQGTINFDALGEGDRLAARSEIAGTIAGPGFLEQAGYGEQEKQSVRDIIANIDRVTGRLAETMEGGLVGDAEAGVRSFREVADAARTKWPEWSGKADEIVGNIADASERAPDLAESVDARLEEIRALLGDARGYLRNHRAAVDETVENVRSASGRADAFLERLNAELADSAARLLADGEAAMADARAALEQTRAVVVEQRPTVERVLTNLSLGSDQLRATLAEVRRSPWRLVYRPDTRELENELLYDAARLYAGAVSELSRTASSLEAVAGARGLSEPEQTARVAELAEQLERALTDYRDAEQTLVDRVLEGAAQQQD